MASPPKKTTPTKKKSSKKLTFTTTAKQDFPTLHDFTPKAKDLQLNDSQHEEFIIAYVHDLSPTKRNRGNSMDYCTLTLQTSASESHEALLYSLAKRSLLLQSQTSRTPVKIRNYTRTDDILKIVINDMANINTPEQHEYNSVPIC
ncbi:hypothetical protein QZH41_004624 [Actinostola sp. cb2023]|nr:hypothetical protein QZH41_004624 [Actinostola sp. cb2023]